MELSMCLIPKNKVSTGNVETMSAMEKLWDHRDSVREGTVKQRHVKAWKATHCRSETESLQVDKNRSRCGHMRTVTGNGSLEDPVNGEDSWRVEQLHHFEKVFENSNGYVGRAARAVEKSRMESNATNAISRRIHSSSERPDSSTAIISQKHRARKEFSKLRAAEYVERNDYAKRDGEVLEEAFNASRSIWV